VGGCGVITKEAPRSRKWPTEGPATGKGILGLCGLKLRPSRLVKTLLEVSNM